VPPIELVLPVILTAAAIQSLFGVGVLLLGTPWMLLLGMDFAPTLQLLLPISLTINVLQLTRDHGHIDRPILRRIWTLTLPAIAMALWVSTRWSPPLELFVAVLVLTFSLQDRVAVIRRTLERLLAFERTYVVLMGLVHGASNLGGSMLTALAFGKGLDRRVARRTIAAGYTLFAVVQLSTLALAGTPWLVDFGRGGGLVLAGGATFLLMDRFVFPRFDPQQFRKGLEALLVATGGLLVWKTFQG
jgi:hypothetical protein